MARSEPDKATQTDLLVNLAEQVKQPFVQIAHAAELLAMQADPLEYAQTRESIAVSARAALQLIDGYLLSIDLSRQAQLELEPVSLSSVLYDSAHQLDAYAKSHDCKIELDVVGKYGPVMGHRRAIEYALVSLGVSFIEAVAANNATTTKSIRLAVRKNAHGFNTGVFANTESLSEQLLKRARVLAGKVHQPLADFDGGNGTGVLVADNLFEHMHTTLKVAQFRSWQGLAATFAPSRQLSLV